MTLPDILLLVIQVFVVIVFSPLVSGLIRKSKDNLRMRKGASVLQPYYNIAKLFSKGQVVSNNSSWIFAFTPFVVLASSVTACFMLPVFNINLSMSTMGDVLVIFFILALGRFFIALAGLDTGSAFGGMGSSREMFISSVAEPAAFISLFVLSMNCGSTSTAVLGGLNFIRASTLLAGVALFMVALAETSRIPVDNRETHLELTMVHEAMVLEYSGRSLALIELAGHIRQVIFFTMLSWFFFPFASGTKWQWIIFPVKIIVIGLVISIIEVSLAKMRLFRVLDYVGFALVIALVAVVASTIGV